MLPFPPLYSIPHFNFTITGLPVKSFKNGLGLTINPCADDIHWESTYARERERVNGPTCLQDPNQWLRIDQDGMSRVSIVFRIWFWLYLFYFSLFYCILPYKEYLLAWMSTGEWSQMRYWSFPHAVSGSKPCANFWRSTTRTVPAGLPLVRRKG